MNHIAMVIPTIDQIGGAERQVLLLAQELAARGWRVTVVALSGTGGHGAQELAGSRVAYLPLEMKKAWIDPRSWLRFLRWARQQRPDILHAHLPHATYFTRWVRLVCPVRVAIDTIHTSSTGSAARRRAYRWSASLSDHVTCVSQAVADAAIAAGIVVANSLSVIPNGVPLPALIQPSANVRPGFTWIAVGRLALVKDYPTLLRAFALLETCTHLRIVGTGSQEQHLRSLADQLHIAGRVEFLGFHPDIQPLLAQADAFVLSSLWEGLPIGVLEAQAACLPVVATDGPGTRHALDLGRTGLIVPISDPSALAIAMRAIMEMRPAERKKMGERGRRFVEEHYALPKIVDRWEALYRQLLEQHPRATRSSTA